MEIGRNLNFEDHLISLCKKAGRKLAVLARLSKFMSFKQKQILMKTFVESQFGYCPLIWMFHRKKVNCKINHLQEQSLRIVYNDYITQPTFRRRINVVSTLWINVEIKLIRR